MESIFQIVLIIDHVFAMFFRFISIHYMALLFDKISFPCCDMIWFSCLINDVGHFATFQIYILRFTFTVLFSLFFMHCIILMHFWYMSAPRNNFSLASSFCPVNVEVRFPRLGPTLGLSFESCPIGSCHSSSSICSFPYSSSFLSPSIVHWTPVSNLFSLKGEECQDLASSFVYPLRLPYQ